MGCVPMDDPNEVETTADEALNIFNYKNFPELH